MKSKIFNYKFVTLITFIYFTPNYGSADILYIDTNQTSNEIKLFQDYADCLGEKLVVVPNAEKREFFSKRGQVINQVKAQKKSLELKFEQTQCYKQGQCTYADRWNLLCNAEKLSTQCSNKYNVIRQLYLDLTTNNGQLPSRYHASDLQRDLLQISQEVELVDSINDQGQPIKIKQPKYNFTTLVISGHHYNSGSGGYQGEVAWLDEEDAVNILQRIPPLANKIKSSIFLACKPLLLERAQQNWGGTLFPQVKLLIGYKENGYAHNSPEGNRYVANIIRSHSAAMNEMAEIESSTADDAQTQRISEIFSKNFTPTQRPLRLCIVTPQKTLKTLDIESKQFKAAAKANKDKSICQKPKT